MSRSASIPLTSAQQAIWYAQNLSPAVPFTIAFYVNLVGRVDLDLLADCARRAHREFGSTTVRVAERDGIPELHVQDDRPLVSTVDLRSSADPEADAYRWMAEDCLAPLPLTGDSLVTGIILRLDDTRCFWYTRAHHIVLDGYGSMMVLRRTAELFLAISAGDVPAPIDPMTPDDAVEADAAYRLSPRHDRDGRYWSGVVAELAPQQSLGGRTAPPSASPLRLDGVMVDSAAVDRSDQGTRMSASMIAAFAILHARLNDSADAVLALPVAGRHTARLRRSGGTHSNVVPLALAGIGTTTVGGAVKIAESAVTSALRHQLFHPAFGPGDENLRGPVVNLMLFDDRVPLGDVEGDVHVLVTGPVADLALDIYPGRSDAEWRWNIEANPSVYSTEDIAVIARRFTRVMAQVLRPDNHDRGVVEIDVEDPNSTVGPVLSGRPADATETLPDILLRHVGDHPNRVAVRESGRTLTYAELDGRSASIADAIRRRGHGVGDTVAVLIPRSVESVVALWAVARTGATYLPVDISYPSARVAYMLSDSGSALALCTAATRDIADAHGVATLDVCGDIADGADRSPQACAADVRPDAAAYVIYTSGTTGSPKGVAVTHSGLGPLVAQMNDAYRLGVRSRVMHCASPGFDTALVEVIAAAVAGCTLVVLPPHIVGGHELTEYLAAESATHLFATPSILSTLNPRALSSLEVVVTGGERCPVRLAEDVSAHVALFNAYGPTETTCSVTMTESLTPCGAVTIGSPMRGVDALVLDRGLRPRPAGTRGELYIAGPSLARGYIGRAADTASRFVADPSGPPGRRMYRTGDVVRRHPDDTLDFLGRSDDQVEFHGVRIEPAEIDAALAEYDPVLRSITVVATVGDGHSVLASYVVPKPSSMIDSAATRAYLADLLPSYMVPSVVTVLDRLPLTPNRKVDVRALPAPTSTSGPDGIVEPPEGPTEIALAEIFGRVLARSVVDVTTSFFELGGDSLTATRVVGQINSEMSIAVGVRDLVAHPTVRSLAAASTTLQSAPVSRPIPGASDGVAVVPLAPAQSHIDRTTDVALYNLPFTLTVTGELDVRAVESAVADILERHRTLRTLYRDSRGGPHQIVLPMSDAHVPVVECDSMDALLAVLHRGFDVSSDLPIRFASTRDGDGHLVIGGCVHHIAADGWSLGILARDMLHAVAQRLAGAKPTWTELPLQYTDYALWASTVATSTDIDFWRTELAGAPTELPLPFDRDRPNVASLRAGRVSTRLGYDVTRRLTDVAIEHRTGLYTVLRAALVIALAQISDTTDIVIGTPTAGRTDPMLDDLVGMFVNTLALRTDVSTAHSMSDVIRSCSAGDARALDHADVQFDDLVELLRPPRPGWVHPYFQVALSFDTFAPTRVDIPALGIPALGIDVMPRPVDIARCDLHVHVTAGPTSGGDTAAPTIDVVYSLDTFDRSTAMSITDRFLDVLSLLSTEPSAPWSISPNSQEL
ncbi:MAG: amino acid adenylation domain-containing protein [Rhodococcus sp. (in: high G+C Gram-positive bacteria)]